MIGVLSRVREVCGLCFGLGVIETTQSIGVPPTCEHCDGRGYLVHATNSDNRRTDALGDIAGETLRETAGVSR